ncbi:hypothetical protein J41TS4_20350 [Paenibacillus apis]|uniref:DUF4878 domain-containing protein n=1 Tax=Paenibacillus apis TaxID=1792174 RepID=A0A919Y538_9BACL|nr:hypothetical protein J41TS4_20350 [Paenibacillus apis]
MRAKMMIVVLVVAVMLMGCSKGISNDTPEAAAKTFIEALINGDEDTLNKINRSSSLDYPTSYLLSDFAPEYADRKIEDFTFEVISNEKVLAQSKDGEKKWTLRIKKIGDGYFFTGK